MNRKSTGVLTVSAGRG